MTDSFAGDKKAPMQSPLAKIERRFIDENVDKFPSWITSWQLTLMTIPWSLGLILFGWLAASNRHWLWLSSLMLFLQWFTDSFDGTLGRVRGAGLVKWGYYMDHFLDYLFNCALIIGYLFIVEGTTRWLLIFMLPLFSAFWVSSFLSFNILNEFQITYLGVGPTELRLLFILINTFIIVFGAGAFAALVPALLVFTVGCLILVVYSTSRRIWAIDMQKKRSAAFRQPGNA